MTLSLNKPAANTVGWAAAINQNFTDIEDAINNVASGTHSTTAGASSVGVAVGLECTPTSTPSEQGFGTAMDFRAQNDAGVMTTIGQVQAEYVTATNTNEFADVVIRVVDDGAMVEVGRFNAANGQRLLYMPRNTASGLPNGRTGCSGLVAHDNGTWLSVNPSNVRRIFAYTQRTNEAHTADDTLGATESGSTHTNYGAAGAIALTIPGTGDGLNFRFAVQVAQFLRVNGIIRGDKLTGGAGTISTSTTYWRSNQIGAWLEVERVLNSASAWQVVSIGGTWTVDA